MMPASASLTNTPAQGVTSAVKRASSSTGMITGRSLAWPTIMSSAPKAGAMWTMPVPSSVATKSAAMTRQAGLSGVDEAVGRLVVAPDQLGAREGLLDDGVGAEHGGDQVGGQDEVLVAQLGLRVRDVRAHGRGHVGDERPGRGGPDQQADTGRPSAARTGAGAVAGEPPRRPPPPAPAGSARTPTGR